MKLQAAFPMRQKEDHKTTTMERLQQVKAATTIQRHWKRWRRNSQQLDMGLADDNSLNVIGNDQPHRSSLQRLIGDNKLTRTLSSLSIRSPFSRKRLDDSVSSSPETNKKTPVPRTQSERKANNNKHSPKHRSILRSSDSGSPSSSRLSDTINSSMSSSRKVPVRKKGHQVSFYTPSEGGSSVTQTTVSKASTNEDDIIEAVARDGSCIGNDFFYSDDDDNDDVTSGNEAPKDEKCSCNDCTIDEAPPSRKPNVHLIASYEKETIADRVNNNNNKQNNNNNNNNSINNNNSHPLARPRTTNAQPVLKTHQLTPSLSTLSLKDMPNVKL